MSKWQGTPVPNSGYVENVYFNTNLSTKEVVDIIENADLNYDEQNIYVLFSNADGSTNICVIYVSSDEVYIYNGNTALFGTSKMSGVDWLGWNPNLINNSNCYNLNTENVIGDYGMGTQNAQLSSLISTTPFVQEQLTLNSFLTGIADAIRSKKGTTDKINASNFASEIASISGGSGGGQNTHRPVMPSGYIENVYFNTALSNEEVISILSNANLTYNDYFASEIAGVDTYHLIMVGEISPKDTSNTTLNQNITSGMFLLHIPQINVYIIADGNLSPIYSSQAVEGFTTFEGWKKDFSGVISMNNKAISIYFTANGGTYYIGAENDKLTQLFSITPFN